MIVRKLISMTFTSVLLIAAPVVFVQSFAYARHCYPAHPHDAFAPLRAAPYAAPAPSPSPSLTVPPLPLAPLTETSPAAAQFAAAPAPVVPPYCRGAGALTFRLSCPARGEPSLLPLLPASALCDAAEALLGAALQLAVAPRVEQAAAAADALAPAFVPRTATDKATAEVAAAAAAAASAAASGQLSASAASNGGWLARIGRPFLSQFDGASPVTDDDGSVTYEGRTYRGDGHSDSGGSGNGASDDSAAGESGRASVADDESASALARRAAVIATLASERRFAFAFTGEELLTEGTVHPYSLTAVTVELPTVTGLQSRSQAQLDSQAQAHGVLTLTSNTATLYADSDIDSYASGLASASTGTGSGAGRVMTSSRPRRRRHVYVTLPWTPFPPLSVYSSLQARFWGLGLFAYYTPAQLPNFLLAAPALLAVFWGALAWLRALAAAAEVGDAAAGARAQAAAAGLGVASEDEAAAVAAAAAAGAAAAGLARTMTGKRSCAKCMVGNSRVDLQIDTSKSRGTYVDRFGNLKEMLSPVPSLGANRSLPLTLSSRHSATYDGDGDGNDDDDDDGDGVVANALTSSKSIAGAAAIGNAVALSDAINSGHASGHARPAAAPTAAFTVSTRAAHSHSHLQSSHSAPESNPTGVTTALYSDIATSIAELPYWGHILVLTVTALTVMHVQVATRFLSACPALYWALARFALNARPRAKAQQQTGAQAVGSQAQPLSRSQPETRSQGGLRARLASARLRHAEALRQTDAGALAARVGVNSGFGQECCNVLTTATQLQQAAAAGSGGRGRGGGRAGHLSALSTRAAAGLSLVAAACAQAGWLLCRLVFESGPVGLWVAVYTLLGTALFVMFLPWT